MYKRHLIFVNLAVLLLGMALSCDKSYRRFSAEEGPCPVVFDGAPDISVHVETRASAGETKGTWTGSDIVWVYGVERKKAGDGAPSVAGALDLENIFIDRVSCDPTQEFFHVYKPGTSSMYDYGEGTYYDFFAYDSGGAPLYEPETTTLLSGDKTPKEAKNAAASTISYDVVIDGNQDVRLGWADKWTDAQKRDWYPERTYSATAARHSVNPHLSFHHMLSRFVVYVSTGFSDSDPRAGEYDVTITRIRVKSVTRARLNVVRPLTDPVDEKNPIAAIVPMEGDHEENVKELFLYTEGGKFEKEIVPAQESQLVGEVMLMPGSPEYTVNLTLIHKQSHSETGALLAYQVPVTVHFPGGAVAKPGFQYKVNLKIWGPESVSAEATLTEWKDSGQFNLDPDNEYN